MIEKINMYNDNRQTGKTNFLKLTAINASIVYYDKVIITTSTINNLLNLKEYFYDLLKNCSITNNKFNSLDFIRTDNLINKLKGYKYHNVLLLIDEAFIIDLETQNKILTFLEESNIKFHIIGSGTGRKKKTFYDYIK